MSSASPATRPQIQPAGRGTDGEWPYYNLECWTNSVILGVGWPAQWAASFTRDDQTGLRVRAGQELTHLILRPGESLRPERGTGHRPDAMTDPFSVYQQRPSCASAIWLVSPLARWPMTSSALCPGRYSLRSDGLPRAKQPVPNELRSLP